MDGNDSLRVKAQEDQTPPALRADSQTSEPCLKGSPCDKPPPSLPNLFLPDSSSRPLNDADMNGQTADTVGLMRNGIYAEHGRAFVNPKYAEFFQQQGFQVNPNFKDSDLNPMEQRNVLFLHMTELTNDLNGQRNAFKPNSDAQPNLEGTVIGDSSTRLLDADEVSQLSPQDLRRAQNDIYASHGYPFQTEQAKNYYSQFSWYQADPNYSESNLSWVEERNLELMHMTELDRKLGSN